MSMKTSELWNSFAVWYFTPDDKRGEITSEVAWAKANGVTDRTVRRWKADERFQAVLALHNPSPGVEAVRNDFKAVSEEDEVGGDEGDYRLVKATLIEGAKTGNAKYIDLYFKTYGKPFVEEEVAARSADLSSKDLEELVAEALVILGEEALVSFLRSKGWVIGDKQ